MLDAVGGMPKIKTPIQVLIRKYLGEKQELDQN